jgi:hypothetical protein
MAEYDAENKQSPRDFKRLRQTPDVLGPNGRVPGAEPEA